MLLGIIMTSIIATSDIGWPKVRCLAYITWDSLHYVGWPTVRCLAYSTMADLQYVVWPMISLVLCYGYQIKSQNLPKFWVSFYLYVYKLTDFV